MSTFKGEMEHDIETTLRDLFADKDRYHKLDLEVLIRVITEFVFNGENFETINDTNRYEASYIILGKAVSAVQGWKINCVEQIQLPSETERNLRNYIQSTYGVNALNAA